MYLQFVRKDLVFDSASTWLHRFDVCYCVGPAPVDNFFFPEPHTEPSCKGMLVHCKHASTSMHIVQPMRATLQQDSSRQHSGAVLWWGRNFRFPREFQVLKLQQRVCL